MTQVPVPPVAICVVSWNTRDLLDACLRALRPEHEAGRAEVWVVDNASTDGSAEHVARQHPWVHLRALGQNLGYGPAVNLVAGLTSTPFLVAANSDVRPTPGAIGALLDAAARLPHAAVLAPRLVVPDGRTQHTVHPFPTVRTGLLLSSGLAGRAPFAARLPMEGHWDPAVERDVDWAHGAFLLVRRTAWDRVGGFDPDQWLYAEDLDLCWRMRRAGWRTRYVPAAVVHHEVSAATAGRWDEAARSTRTQRSAYAWIAHRQGLARARAVGAAHLAGPALRWAVRAVAARADARHRAERDRQRRYVAMHRTAFEPRAVLDAHRRGDTARR